MTRIECETATQCEQFAQMMEAAVVDAVVWTTVGVVALVVLHRIYTLSGGVSRMTEHSVLRLWPRDEHDWLPAVYWFVIAHAIGVVSHFIVALAAREWFGMAGVEAVAIKGGGETSTVMMASADLWGMRVQMVVFLVVFGGLFFYSGRR